MMEKCLINSVVISKKKKSLSTRRKQPICEKDYLLPIIIIKKNWWTISIEIKGKIGMYDIIVAKAQRPKILNNHYPYLFKSYRNV